MWLDEYVVSRSTPMATSRHRKDRTIPTATADHQLSALGRSLERRRKEARRHWRRWQALKERPQDNDATRAGEDWSNSVDATLEVSEVISRVPARDLESLATKFEAVWWWLVEDDSILDASARRWLARFRRSLRQLAAKE